MDHVGKFFMLGNGQIRAVDHPVIVAPAVEAILLPHTVGNHLSFGILFPWDWVGFLVGGSICRHRRCRCCHCHCRCQLALLCKGNAPPSNTPGLALLVGEFLLVRELEDLVLGAGDGVQTHEGIVVDFFLEVPVSLVAEAMKE
jgi:hypothetical protein